MFKNNFLFFSCLFFLKFLHPFPPSIYFFVKLLASDMHKRKYLLSIWCFRRHYDNYLFKFCLCTTHFSLEYKINLLKKKSYCSCKKKKKLLNWLLDLNEFHFLNFKISVIVFPHCDKYVKFNTKFQLTLYNFYITPMYVLRIGQDYLRRNIMQFFDYWVLFVEPVAKISR